MSFELRTSADLAPYVCAVCHCHKDEPHLLISNLTDENGMAVFVCRECTQEMADVFGITKAEVPEPVEVPREPTDSEMLDFLAFRLSEQNRIRGEFGGGMLSAFLPRSAEATNEVNPQSAISCECGKTYTGPAAKANMARHKATCPAAKEAGAGGTR